MPINMIIMEGGQGSKGVESCTIFMSPKEDREETEGPDPTAGIKIEKHFLIESGSCFDSHVMKSSKK